MVPSYGVDSIDTTFDERKMRKLLEWTNLYKRIYTYEYGTEKNATPTSAIHDIYMKKCIWVYVMSVPFARFHQDWMRTIARIRGNLLPLNPANFHADFSAQEMTFPFVHVIRKDFFVSPVWRARVCACVHFCFCLCHASLNADDIDVHETFQIKAFIYMNIDWHYQAISLQMIYIWDMKLQFHLGRNFSANEKHFFDFYTNKLKKS